MLRSRAWRRRRKQSGSANGLLEAVCCVCLTSLCVAFCGLTDDSCEGQAEVYQKRRLSSRPLAAWPSWLGNTSRRPQKRLCQRGFADTWVSALARAPTPSRTAGWSRGLSHSTNDVLAALRDALITEVAHCVRFGHGGSFGNASRRAQKRLCQRGFADTWV